jgi:hypothetical protein
MSTNRSLAAASLVCTLLLPGCSSEPSSQPADAATWQVAMGQEGLGFLDGRTFVCEMTGAGETTEETLEFHGGRFHSVNIDQYGFSTGNYTATRQGGTTSFQSVTSSKSDGRIDWRGQVKGNTIEGSAIWSRPGQGGVNYTFRGTERPAESK